MFLFLLHLERCRFMSVDVALQAIFHFNAILGDLLTLFSKQFSIAMPCKVICLCFEGLHLEWCRFSCVLTLFSNHFNISMPCQVICLSFE